MSSLNTPLRLCCELREDARPLITCIKSLESTPGSFPSIALGPQLREVRISNAYLKDLSQLTSRCPGLTCMDCSSTWVVDLSPLARCVALETLLMKRLRVPSFAPLSSCTALRVLDASFCQKIADINPLSACARLQQLYLCKTPVRSLSSLVTLSLLEVLDVGGTQVTSLAGLPRAGVLTKLVFRDTHVLDFSPLLEQRALRHVDMSNTWVIRLDNVPTAALTKLMFGCTRVDNLQPLSACAQLQHVTMGETMASDLTPLSSCVELKHLVLGDFVEDLTPLSSCTSLETLDLGRSSGETLAPLPACTKLRTLHLSRQLPCDRRPVVHVATVIVTGA